MAKHLPGTEQERKGSVLCSHSICVSICVFFLASVFDNLAPGNSSRALCQW